MKNFKLLFAFLAISSLVLATESTDTGTEVEPTNQQEKDSVTDATESTDTKTKVDQNVQQSEPTINTEDKTASKSYLSLLADKLNTYTNKVHDYVLSLDNAVHTALQPSAAVNEKGEQTYLTQAQNFTVNGITLPFRRPVTTAISALVVYALYAAYQEYNQDEIATEQNN